MFDIVVAVCQKYGIGYLGQLPWPHIKEDLKHFYKITTSGSETNAVIMGRKTWESLPDAVRPLSGRDNYVLTKNEDFESSSQVRVFRDFNDAITHACATHDRVFVIGGAQIYKLALEHPGLRYIHVTRILKHFKSDTFFPPLNTRLFMRIDDTSLFRSEQFVPFKFQTYQRVNVQERQYLNILKTILEEGTEREDRTGTGTLSMFALMLRFDLSHSFPLLTTKKTFWRGIVEELLWFIKGSTNAKDLQDKGIHIWDGNTSREYLDSVGLHEYPEGCLGPGYGHQWRHFGAKYVDCHTDYQGVDQLSQVIQQIKEDPWSRRHIVTAWNPVDLPKIALPPCFLKDTLVLSSQGYMPIQKIDKSLQLYTHEGQFQDIMDIHKTVYNGNICSIRRWNAPCDIHTTPEHPFYAKLNDMDKPKWVPAKDLQKGHFIGMHINQNSKLPTFDIVHRAKSIDSLDDWFLMGYYVGNGWLDWTSDKYRFYFTIAEKDIETILPRLQKVVKLNEIKTKTANVREYEGRKQDWWTILEKFGPKAHGTKIPFWIHDAPKEYIKAFIEGYVAADGYIDENGSVQITTVSADLAFSVQRLYFKLGKMCSVNYQKRPPTVVNQKNAYHIYQRTTKRKSNLFHFDSSYAWFAVRDIKTKSVENEIVYNFAVAQDNSYVVENAVVHNCHMLYQFYVHPHPETGKPEGLSCRMIQRSADMFLGVPFNIASYALLTLMVAQVTNLKPRELIMEFGDAHIYKNAIEQCKQQIAREPKCFPLVRLNPKVKNLDEFTSQDIKLVNYEHYPGIKAKMAV